MPIGSIIPFFDSFFIDLLGIDSKSGKRIFQEDKVLGFLNPEDLRLYYQTVDAIILPSLYDAFSLVTLEAMACGAIPVVSKYAGVAELISNGFNGFIIDPLIKGSLSETMEQILNMSQSKMQTMRNNAIYTAKKYSWMNTARYFLNLLSHKLSKYESHRVSSSNSESYR